MGPVHDSQSETHRWPSWLTSAPSTGAGRGWEIIQENKALQMLVVNELWLLWTDGAVCAFNKRRLLLLNLNQPLFWTAGDLSKGHKSSLGCRGVLANTRRILPSSTLRMVCLGKTTRRRARVESQACKEWVIFNEPVCTD